MPHTLSNTSCSQIVLKLLLLLCGFSAFTVLAEQNECEQPHQCVPIDAWHFGVALGAGVTLSPLVDGDNIPLVVLPDIAYYGENFYWDNTEVGYQWTQQKTWYIDTFFRLNSERAAFSVWDVNNFFVASFDSAASVAGSNENSEEESFPGGIDNGARLIAPPTGDIELSTPSVSIRDINDRHWAVDVGIRLHLFQKSGEWTFAFFNDASGVYSGKHAKLEYKHGFNWGQWHIKPTLSLAWKSSELTDYYYGLDARDGLLPFQYYEGQAGWQPSVKVVASRPINLKWSWLAFASYQHLHKGMRRSPLVRRNSIISAFAGVSYRF